jgi:hypothetical protein
MPVPSSVGRKRVWICVSTCSCSGRTMATGPPGIRRSPRNCMFVVGVGSQILGPDPEISCGSLIRGPQSTDTRRIKDLSASAGPGSQVLPIAIKPFSWITRSSPAFTRRLPIWQWVCSLSKPTRKPRALSEAALADRRGPRPRKRRTGADILWPSIPLTSGCWRSLSYASVRQGNSPRDRSR